MDRQRIYHYVLIGLLLALLYVAFLVVQPFLTYLILGFILTYLLHPVYRRLARKLGSDWWASLLMVLLILVVVILPSAWIVSKLVTQSVNAYNTFRALELDLPPTVESLLQPVLADPDLVLDRLAKNTKDFIVNQAPNILGSIADVILGLFIMFFFIFYAFLNGERWLHDLRRNLPMEKAHRERLFDRMGSITSAVVYGQFLTAVIQGSLGGLMFIIFGIPNPVFWGVIMIILSFLPLVGTPIIWVPVALLELLQGRVLAGVGILIVGSVVVMNVDNLVRPYLISSRDNLNPVLILIGVLGGLKLFGFIGILIGPLLLALLQTVIELFREKPRKKKKSA